MSFQTVVFTEDTRVVTGDRVAWFKAGVPRAVHPELARAALGMGASAPKTSHDLTADSTEVTAAAPPPKPKAKRKRAPRKKKRADDVIIADAVEFMTTNQPNWIGEECYDLNNLPRMHLFSEAVPDLTPTLREAAWDTFISGQVGG